MDGLGLRERKKLRTRAAILDAAYSLFRESGFDAVSVADIAAAAEISKPTLFAYFQTKEDLALSRFLFEERDPASVVRDRDAQIPALDALRRDFVERLGERDPLTGLNDSPEAVFFHDLLYRTPTIMARLSTHTVDRERRLSFELNSTGGFDDAVTAHLVATHVFGTQRVLADHNARQIREGRSADDLHPDAVERANAAYDLIRYGTVPTETTPSML